MKRMRIIVGCDIKGYSSLDTFDQRLLTAHLEGVHIKSLASVYLEPIAFNDTGDGFFVLFESDTETKNSVLRYIQFLSVYYLSEGQPMIVPLVNKHWLKIVAGVGDVIVTPQKVIRGDGINRVARILEIAKRSVPFVTAGKDQMVDCRQAGCMSYSDKHGDDGDGMAFLPYYLDAKSEKDLGGFFAEEKYDCLKSPCVELDHISFNHFFLLKKPKLPDFFYDISEETWRHLNEYIFLRDWIKKSAIVQFPSRRSEQETPDSLSSKKERELQYIDSIYIIGHTLKALDRALSQVADFLNFRAEVPQELVVRIVYLDPRSGTAKYLRDEDKTPLRDEIVKSLKKIAALIKKYPVLEQIEIAFTNKPVAIGTHKVLDYMLVIHYGDEHFGKKAKFQLFNFFGTREERNSFKNFLDHYFSRLWDASGDPLSNILITEKISGDEVPLFLEKLSLEDRIPPFEACNDSLYIHFLSSELIHILCQGRNATNTLELFTKVRQIELHPSVRCQYQCSFCHGLPKNGEKRHKEGMLTLSQYKIFLGPITKDKVDLIVISGEYSEPMLYDGIGELVKMVGEKGIPVGFYSNGLKHLGPVLNHLVEGSYIILNIPTVDPKGVKNITKFDVDKEYLGFLTKNIESILDSKPNLSVKVNFELTWENCNKTFVQGFLDYMKDFNASITIRFNLPVVPAKYSSCMDYKSKTLDLFVRALEVLRSDDFSDVGALKVIKTLDPIIGNHFSQCFAMFDSIVVDPFGNVIPCCYTTTKEFSSMRFGDIKSDSLDALLDKRYHCFQKMSQFESRPRDVCPPCSRKDYIINTLGWQGM